MSTLLICKKRNEVVIIDILEVVTNALQPIDSPCIYGWYDQNLSETHITFLEFDNQEEDYSDDEATSIEHHIQVDIWTKDTNESQSLKKQVKELLKKNGFIYQNGQDLFEIENQLWHIPQRFLILEYLE